MAKMDKWGKCKAYDGFKELLDELRRSYSMLNPKDGLCSPQGALSDHKDVAMEFIRGGIIRVMAAWEAYVQDVLREAFDIVVEMCGNVPGGLVPLGLASLTTKWPEYHAVLHKAIERHVGSSLHGNPAPENEKSLKQLLHNESSPERITSLQRLLQKKSHSEKIAILQVEVALDLATNKDHLKKLLDEHRDHMLKQLVTPVFDGNDGIDDTFRRLFGIQDKNDFELSSKMVDMGRITHLFYCNVVGDGSQVLKRQLEITHVQTLHHLMRFYYGARCAFAHGDHQRTLDRALHKFPKRPADLNVGDPKIAHVMFQLYQGIIKDGRKAIVNHLTLVHLCRFIFCAVHRLYLAIAHWVYDRFHECIWTYDPDRDESLVLEQEQEEEEEDEGIIAQLYPSDLDS